MGVVWDIYRVCLYCGEGEGVGGQRLGTLYYGRCGSVWGV